MANHSQQQNETSSFPWFSTSECIAWLTALGMEAVAIVTLNVLTITVYLKERSLRKRSLYLVINQAVADMLVAGCVIVWIIAGLCSAIGVLDAFYPFTIKLSRSLFTLYLAFFLFCLLIILGSYSSIAIKIVCGNQPHHHGATSRERKLTKTLFIITLLLMQPNIFFWILDSVSSRTFNGISLQTWFRLYYSFGFLLCANSLVNPVCCAFRIPEFRRALCSCLRSRFQPQPDQVF